MSATPLFKRFTKAARIREINHLIDVRAKRAELPKGFIYTLKQRASAEFHNGDSAGKVSSAADHRIRNFVQERRA